MPRRTERRRAHRALLLVEEKRAKLAGIVQCASAWPLDPPGPNYVGTRCELIERHKENNGTQHRKRIEGTSTIVTWD